MEKDGEIIYNRKKPLKPFLADFALNPITEFFSQMKI